jgi:hypothetical protein
LTAACLGFLGGCLKNLHVLLSFLFAPQGTNNIYVITGLLFAEQLLFVPTICATRGIAQRSLPLLKTGLLIGLAMATITAGTILALIYVGIKDSPLFRSWFEYVVVSAPLLGIAVGVVSWKYKPTALFYSYVLIGLIGGCLAVFSYYMTLALSTGLELLLSRAASPYASRIFFTSF